VLKEDKSDGVIEDGVDESIGVDHPTAPFVESMGTSSDSSPAVKEECLFDDDDDDEDILQSMEQFTSF
jgi:hypothetical protein